MKLLPLLLFILLFLSACSPSRQIGKSAHRELISDPSLQMAHVGISVYDPASGHFLFNYQGDKFFVPASNTKIATCYAAMKYLGDSLVGLRYGIPAEKGMRDVIVIQPAGDPTFLHEDFPHQPVIPFLAYHINEKNIRPGFLMDTILIPRWGNGWSWNDYASSYMAERNAMPVFGNTITIRLRDTGDRFIPHPIEKWRTMTRLFTTGNRYFDSIVNGIPQLQAASGGIFRNVSPYLKLEREIDANRFRIHYGNEPFRTMSIPFVTGQTNTVLELLEDSLKKDFTYVEPTSRKGIYNWLSDNGDITQITITSWQKIHSQHTDSLLRPMMHESDNFFAEQCLLMASNELLELMDEKRIIDTLLKSDFAGLQQSPRWVDGSGLSRYNLFTPRNFVSILDRMRTSFGMDRIREIFPTGNEGTLRNYYKEDSSFIYAKTGTLSGVVALSGFLYTRRNRLLIFSVLVNNHRSDATSIRRAIERFIRELRRNN